MQRIVYYKNLGQEELWLDCAEKLTAMIQNIIEFAKLIPGFMRLSQDDQVSWSIEHHPLLLITHTVYYVLVFRYHFHSVTFILRAFFFGNLHRTVSQ